MGDVAQCLNGTVTAGDLVRVVLPRACCGSHIDTGLEYRVSRVAIGLVHCRLCGFERRTFVCVNGPGKGTPASMLIRLDPPALPESVEDVAKVPA